MAATEELITIDPFMTRADRYVLENLIQDIRDDRDYEDDEVDHDPDAVRDAKKQKDRPEGVSSPDDAVLATLDALNSPGNSAFEPTVFTGYDLRDLQEGVAARRKMAADARSASVGQRVSAAAHSWFHRAVLEPYIRFAQRHVVRHETDVVFCTHLLLYFSTVVPSAAALLFWRFSWLHGIAHVLWVLLGCIGSYTIMMHQHIHQGGILRRDQWWTAGVDRLFPYLMDPLIGHTWNSYYYHHVKHHHVEANGPDDLSSTMWYQRDSLVDFGKYLGRFLVLAWFDLPLYFVRTRRVGQGVRAGFWELSSYGLLAGSVLAGAHHVLVTDQRAAVFVFVLPFVILRIGLMLGNWGQHAFVDPDAPDSDFRSSITVIDIASNRVCFNDGYHTSHHLNPRRHWREHPRAFVAQKRQYAAEQGLVFFGIDYLETSLRLILFQDYAYLAKRLVPLGPEQRRMTLNERAAWLRRLTMRFTEEDVARTYPKSRSAAAWRRKQGQPAA
ncbi:acylamide-delta3(E)-desaturase [Sporothrix schenckii 1099-18]|uniref:Acylamide-delta3(E)-desaturase n=1 Tax=Sporothrix schenckii 1099-18 TaxID=1397361 RepID=A0A0F2MEY7_SPOSC|nr:acylamide-delta3(E)-desaturase [Sporothrix schenckii 1099-18]KJR88253.1 acylamide-delta3(E)-desaturase [Sporothrix schenckii 1099-18]